MLEGNAEILEYVSARVRAKNVIMWPNVSEQIELFRTKRRITDPLIRDHRTSLHMDIQDALLLPQKKLTDVGKEEDGLNVTIKSLDSEGDFLVVQTFLPTDQDDPLEIRGFVFVDSWL